MQAGSSQRSPRARATRRRIGVVILLTGSSLAAFLVLFPSGWVINRLNVQIWWFLRQNTPLPQAMTPEQLAEVWNVVMFVPLGLGLTLILPRWWWAGVLCGLSITIELLQFLVLSTRHPDIGDVVMNTAGGVLGVVVGTLITRWCEKRSNQSIDSPHA